MNHHFHHHYYHLNSFKDVWFIIEDEWHSPFDENVLTPKQYFDVMEISLAIWSVLKVTFNKWYYGGFFVLAIQALWFSLLDEIL